MKKIWQVLFVSLCALLIASPALAQKSGGIFDDQDETVGTNRASSRQLTTLSETLARQAEEISDTIYSDYNRNNNRGGGNRSGVQEVFAAEQFNASADLFYKMVGDRRSTNELRQAATLLQESFRRVSTSGQRNRWSEAQRTLDSIAQELNVNGGYGNGNGNGNGGYGNGNGNGGNARSGRVTWRGTVDDNVQLVIRDNYIEVRTIGGTEYSNATYNFTNALPRQRINLSLNRQSGRGEVRLVQQPSRDNDWTAIVEIRDSKSGADNYAFELTW